MKMRRGYLFLLSILIFVLFANGMKVNAMDTGFETEEISVEKKSELQSEINITLVKEEPEKGGIQCFDVNEQGMIVIAKKGNFCEEFCVYSSDGEFLYGYTLDDTSQSFVVEWDDGNVNIYFVRSDLIVSVDSKGNILDIKKVLDTIENNTYQFELESPTRTIGNTTYQIRNDMGIFNLIALFYSQIVTIGENGVEKIIYDVNSKIYLHTVVGVIGAFACFFFVVMRLVWEFKKSNSKQ